MGIPLARRSKSNHWRWQFVDFVGLPAVEQPYHVQGHDNNERNVIIAHFSINDDAHQIAAMFGEVGPELIVEFLAELFLSFGHAAVLIGI